MKKYIIKKALVPVAQVTLDNSIIECVDSINFRIDGNKLTNKVSSIHFKMCADSFSVMERIMRVTNLSPESIIENRAGVPVGLDLCSKHVHLVKENVLEIRIEQVVLNEL